VSLTDTSLAPDGRVNAVLVFRNATTSPVTVVRTWLPTSCRIRRRYLEGGKWKDEQWSVGMERGITGHASSARRRSDEYATLAPSESLEVRADLTSWFRNTSDRIPSGEYKATLIYVYGRSEDESGLSLVDYSVESNVVEFVVDGGERP